MSSYCGAKSLISTRKFARILPVSQLASIFPEIISKSPFAAWKEETLIDWPSKLPYKVSTVAVCPAKLPYIVVMCEL